MPNGAPFHSGFSYRAARSRHSGVFEPNTPPTEGFA
ncbi:hypothetical protein SAMN05216215_106032 [Saccharopolyspora shandongensis]|uniref:Uncharacterized protein n=1 Tax=Saccharopolyspora shandongensis TaxID=418495 RepID=A0A1H3S5I6_9PSEU|nr:hypothetical protein SAMN05216215_106032 [Saccharopolyspora shandongensis]